MHAPRLHHDQPQPRARRARHLRRQNLLGFHRKDGAGYRLLADRRIELDRTNPQVAARLITAFDRWRRFDPARQTLMRAELDRVAGTQGLSRDSYEIATKSLA